MATHPHEDPQHSLLRVCRIGRAQGLKGEVNVMVTTDDPERRFAPGSVLLTKHGEPMTVAGSRRFKQRWIVRFEGVADRNASEALRGVELFVEPDREIKRASDRSNDNSLTASGATEFANTVDAQDTADAQDADKRYAVGEQDAASMQDAEFDLDTQYAQDEDDDGFYAEELLGLEVRLPHNAEQPEGAYDIAGKVIDVTESPAQWLLTVREPQGSESLVPFVDPFIPVIDVEEGYLVLTPPKGLLQEH